MLPTLLITLIFAYFIYAIHKLDLHRPALEALCKPVGEWFGEAGNPVTAVLWIVVGILLWVAWFGSEDSIFYKLQGEITGMAFTVIVIDWLVGYRNKLQEKKRIIRQLSSRSNDFALDAARIIKEEEWHKDGSLKNIEIEWADLKNLYLPRAKFGSTHIRHSNLQNATLYLVNFDGAKFTRCQLDGVFLNAASLLHAEFYNVDINKAGLVEINAQGCKFNVVNLEGTALQSANLKDAEFLLGSLKNANLASANLSGANLKTVADIETANLKDALYSNDTVWPDGFDPVAAGAIFVED